MDQILGHLSEATKIQLAPIKGLRDSSFLYVTLTKNGEDFVCEFKSLVCIDEEQIDTARAQNISTITAGGNPYAELGHPPPADVVKWFKRLPEKSPMVKKGEKRALCVRYKVTVTDFNALMITYCWPKDHVIFSKDAKLTFDYLNKRLESQHNRAIQHAEYKINKKLPKIHPLLLKVEEMAPKETKLSEYQLFAAHLGFLQEGLGLFMDRGTGKTPTVIRRMNAEAILHRQGKIGGSKRMMRVLVVAPKNVRLNWLLEVQKFTVLPGKCIVLRGDQPKRVRQLIENLRDESDCFFSVTVTSFDTVASDVDILTRCKFDLLIADESHRFKSAATARWKSISILARSVARKQCLTGTPISNGFVDLWTQLEFLGEGQSGFKSKNKFKNFFGKFETVEVKGQDGFSIEQLVGMTNVPLLQERLVRMTFAITKKEAGLQLPDKVYDAWEVSMTPRQKDIYDKICTKLVAKIEDGGEVNALTANNILTQLLRLAQITSGFVTWDEEFSEDGVSIRPKRTEQIDPGANPKILAVLDMLENDTEPNEKVLIWAIKVEDIETLQEEITAAGYKSLTYYGKTSDKERDFNEQAFNEDPSIKCIIMNPMAASEGLNLLGYNYRDPESEHNDTWTGLEVFYSQNWSMILREQAEDRGHRRGTKKTLRIRDLNIPGTIDTEIRACVTSKIKTANEIQDVSSLLESVLGMGHQTAICVTDQ